MKLLSGFVLVAVGLFVGSAATFEYVSRADEAAYNWQMQMNEKTLARETACMSMLTQSETQLAAARAATAAAPAPTVNGQILGQIARELLR